jgi:hypothetical protein
MIKNLPSLFIKSNFLNRSFITKFSNTAFVCSNQQNIKDDIDKLVKNDSIVVFMKGILILI